MKIALVGEFSGLHAQLKKGLEQLGNQVVLFSSGDGFKSIPFDRRWGPKRGGYISLARFLLISQPWTLWRLGRSFDVVQLIEPSVIVAPNRLQSLYYKLVTSTISKSKALKSLVVAGCDHYVEQRNAIKNPILCHNCLKDKGKTQCHLRENGYNVIASTAAKFCDVIIPFSTPTYAQAYASFGAKNASPLMFPIDAAPFSPKPNRPEGKIKVLHGINRPGFKGSELILAAMEKVKQLHPDRFEMLVPVRKPYAEYVKLLSDANIVIDQAYADGFGINSLIAMAAGKVLLTSYVNDYNCGRVDYRRVPAINIAGGVEVIVNALLRVKDWPLDQFAACGVASREYVERHCDPQQVAQDVIRLWANSNRSLLG